MKLKKIVASATVITSFVGYSTYQRVFGMSSESVLPVTTASPTPMLSPLPAETEKREDTSATSPAALLLGESPKPTPSPSSSPKTTPSVSSSPKPTPSAKPSVSPSPSPAASPTPSPSPSPSPVPSPTPLSKYKDGQFTGVAADAFYGFIQVKATITNGKITNVVFLQAPNDRSRSIAINNHADPILAQEAIAAQSAQVDVVSGATDSSQAFIISMQSALDQAKN
jgi:uncharacterized protein with FMN-binding domain